MPHWVLQVGMGAKGSRQRWETRDGCKVKRNILQTMGMVSTHWGISVLRGGTQGSISSFQLGAH